MPITKTMETHGFEHPLKHFKGVLKSVEEVIRSFENGGTRTDILFKFTDVEVIESRTPYAFPTTEVTIPWSERDDTPWAAFGSSANKITNSYDANILEGKLQEWKWSPAKLNKPLVDEDGNPIVNANGRQRFGVQDGEAWKVVAIEGFGEPEDKQSATDYILDKVNGKTMEEFKQGIYSDEGFKKTDGWQEAITQLTNGKLLESFVSGGMLKKDEESGKFVKV